MHVFGKHYTAVVIIKWCDQSWCRSMFLLFLGNSIV